MRLLDTMVTIGYKQLIPRFVTPMHRSNDDVGMHVVLNPSGAAESSAEYPLSLYRPSQRP